MDLIEQTRNLLNLVHNNPFRTGHCLNQASKESRLAQQREPELIAEQVEPVRSAEMCPQPRALADRTWTKEKK